VAGIEIIVDCLMGQGYKRNGTDKRKAIEGK
jgi:NAD(P)H-hydrate repair Nnr-like enzyme with NAD(P)H-hydrate epimerase domain